jgi:hypothetical protein
LSRGTAATRLEPTARAEIREQRIVKDVTEIGSIVGRELNEKVNEEGCRLDIGKLGR